MSAEANRDSSQERQEAGGGHDRHGGLRLRRAPRRGGHQQLGALPIGEDVLLSQELKKKIYLIQAARELKIPFVSSGGRGDGKQLAAAIAMDGYNRGFHTRKCQEGSDGWIGVRKTQCCGDEEYEEH